MERRKILVVDDNTVNLAAIEQDLKDYYEVIPMISGRRAIKYLYTEKVDLILLDVEMPMKDGIETLQEIRTQNNGITVPVIFLTANKDKNTVIEGSKLGIMDYITKPFDTNDLIQRIEHVFKKLGMVAITDEELLEALQKTEEHLTHDRILQAISLSEEISGYQIDEEISGRMKNIRTKLSQGEIDTAHSTLKRVINVMEGRLGIQHKIPENIRDRELLGRLLEIERQIKDFQTKDAIATCNQVLKYNLKQNFKDGLLKISDSLASYDDDAALHELNHLVEELKEQRK